VTGTDQMDLTAAVGSFLTHEADLLDNWQLDEWFGLFAPGAVYIVPATDLRDGDAGRDLMLVHDDYFLIQERVKSLLRRSAHAEYPRSRTRRLITNISVRETDPGQFDVRANFLVFRIRAGRTDQYVGSYRHQLLRLDSGEFRFTERRSVLDHENLDQGKLSIIL
jgi:p-cumate 2,3-dioxygenase subunit beta